MYKFSFGSGLPDEALLEEFFGELRASAECECRFGDDQSCSAKVGGLLTDNDGTPDYTIITGIVEFECGVLAKFDFDEAYWESDFDCGLELFAGTPTLTYL